MPLPFPWAGVEPSRRDACVSIIGHTRPKERKSARVVWGRLNCQAPHPALPTCRCPGGRHACLQPLLPRRQLHRRQQHGQLDHGRQRQQRQCRPQLLQAALQPRQRRCHPQLRQGRQAACVLVQSWEHIVTLWCTKPQWADEGWAFRFEGLGPQRMRPQPRFVCVWGGGGGPSQCTLAWPMQPPWSDQHAPMRWRPWSTQFIWSMRV